jgi:hypothetical protein
MLKPVFAKRFSLGVGTVFIYYLEFGVSTNNAIETPNSSSILLENYISRWDTSELFWIFR